MLKADANYQLAEEAYKEAAYSVCVADSPLVAPWVSYDAKSEKWRLEREYCYLDTETGVQFCIPAGFTFDLASVPRLFWWALAPFELSIVAPLLHDALYQAAGRLPEGHVVPTRDFSRRDADQLFMRVMQEEGVNRVRRRTAYLAVRLFGGRAWKD